MGYFKLGGYDSYEVNVGIPGKFNIYNALAAISVCRHCGVGREAIVKGLETVKVKGRVEPVHVSDNFTLLIDYAHNALSMENVLTTLRKYNPNRLITMFGAGGNRPKIRRYEMGEMSGRYSDLSVVTEDNSRFEDVMDIIADIAIKMLGEEQHKALMDHLRDDKGKLKSSAMVHALEEIETTLPQIPEVKEVKKQIIIMKMNILIIRKMI